MKVFVAAVISSRADLRHALRMRKPPDFFELRLDRLVDCLGEVRAAMRRLPAPCIITARHPREGGANNLSTARRRALLLRFLPRASLVDVELRSIRAMAPVLRAARARPMRVILSYHDFKDTPSATRLKEMVARAQSLHGILKVATQTDTPAQLARLLAFEKRHRRSACIIPMGMGKLGRASRLEFARRGSFTYVHLGTPSAPGQLSLQELRRALA
jgi:3-dehydroquinate dehydratase-1